jgi:prepilin-type processing-associated H-X9-DG protein
MKILSRHFCGRPDSKAGISAFTLPELLVVIAIIFVVGGVIIPILVRNKEASMLASCSNNLRQIGVGCQIYSADNDVWPTINLPGSVENFYQTTLACRTTSVPGTQIGVGPYGFGQLYFYAGMNNPQVFYCPSVETGQNSYSWYDAPGYAWPAIAPIAAADPMNNGNPFVRCGYNYYPQSKTAVTLVGGITIPAVTFALQSFTVPNPPGGISPNSSPEPVPMKTTQLNLSKAVAVDALTLFAQINHQYRGQPYGLNALFPDGHVRFQTVAGNNKKLSNKPFDLLLWDPVTSEGPGETSYSEGSGYSAGIIMNGFQP